MQTINTFEVKKQIEHQKSLRIKFITQKPSVNSNLNLTLEVGYCERKLCNLKDYNCIMASLNSNPQSQVLNSQGSCKDKESIQVTIRVRPLSEKQKQEDPRTCIEVQQNNNTLHTILGNDVKKFTFDSIANMNTQEEMFQMVGKNSTKYCLEGYNCTIFAYGQTGSGKTYTMMGSATDQKHVQSQEQKQQSGLIPRTLQFLFESIDKEIKATNAEYIIKCTFLEIYNEQIIDLLNPATNNVQSFNGPTNYNNSLQIREDIKKGVYVEGLREETIYRGQEALEILRKGSKSRHVGSTYYNEASSRSHSVFTMRIESRHVTTNNIVNTKIRYFHFIDLAGSERTKKIEGERFKEGIKINQSLLVLGKVINSLAESSTQLVPSNNTKGMSGSVTNTQKTKHINYRESKLTFLLKESLGGNSKTHLIANVSPSWNSYNETNMTLSFARRVKLIKVNKALINEDSSGSLESLKNENKRLKQEIIQLKSVSIGGSDNYHLTVVSQGGKSELKANNNKKSDSQGGQENNSTVTLNLVDMLNKYVSEEIQKQTKFEVETSNLQKRIQCLEMGIRKYSENEQHFKLIISIYEDKVQRLERIKSQISKARNTAENIQDEEQLEGSHLKYMKEQQQDLQRELETYKKMLDHTNIRAVLRGCNLIGKEGGSNGEPLQSRQNFQHALQLNTSFLEEIKGTLEDIKKSAKARENQQQKYQSENQSQDQKVTLQILKKQQESLLEKQTARLQLEFSTKENEYIEKMQTLEQDFLEMKIVNEELRTANKQSEQLLQESVNRQILMEEKVAQLQTQNNTNLERISQSNKLKEQLEIKLAQIQAQNQEQLSMMEKSKQTAIQKYAIEKQQLTVQVQELQRTVTQLKKASQEKAKENLELQAQMSNQDSQFLLLSKKAESLEQTLSTKEETVKELSESFEALKRQFQHKLKEREDEMEQKVSDYQRKMKQASEQIIESKKINQELQDKITELSDNSKTLERTIENLESNLQREKNHSQQVIEQKSLHEKQLQQKCLHKQEELLQMLEKIEKTEQTGTEINEQINKSKIQYIQLNQVKEQLEYSFTQLQEKFNEISRQKTELQETVCHKSQEILELKKTITEYKIKLNKQKDCSRSMTVVLEELKVQNKTNSQRLQSKLEELKDLHEKQETFARQLNALKGELNEKKAELKEYENKNYCMEKSHEIQVESLRNQIATKDAKTRQLEEKLSQENRVLENKISEAAEKITTLEQELKDQHAIQKSSTESLNKNWEQQLKQKETHVQALKKQIIEGEKDSQESQMRTRHLQAQLSELDAVLVSKCQELNKMAQALHSRNEELKTHKEAYQQLEEQINQMEEQHLQKMEECEVEHDAQLDSKNEIIESKQEHIEELSIKFENLQREVQSLKLSYQKKESEHSALSVEVKQLNGMIEELKKEAQNLQMEHESQIQKLSERNRQERLQIMEPMKIKEWKYKEQCSVIESLEGKLKEKEGEIVQFIAEKEKFAYSLQNLQQKLITESQNSKSNIQALKENMKIWSDARVKQELSALELKHKEALKKQQDELRRDYQKIFSDFKAENQQSTDLKILQVTKNYEQSIYELKTELQSLNYEKQNLQKGLNSYKRQKADLKQRIETLQLIHKQISDSLEREHLQKQRAVQECRIKVEKERMQDKEQQETQKNGLLEEIECLRQSYESLEKINTALGRRCQELLTQLEEQKTENRKLNTKYLSEKSINDNLKDLIQNSEQQKKMLSDELYDKNEVYEKLLNRIANRQNVFGCQEGRMGAGSMNSEHYLKTVDLLEKSRIQQLELRKSNEELKKLIQKLRQDCKNKHQEAQIVKQKAEQYSMAVQRKLQQIQNDYLNLESKYENSKKQNEHYMIQLKEVKPKMSRLTLKVEELEEKNRKFNKEFASVQDQNMELKEKIFYGNGQIKLSNDEMTMNYINQLKSEINQLRKEQRKEESQGQGPHGYEQMNSGMGALSNKQKHLENIRNIERFQNSQSKQKRGKQLYWDNESHEEDPIPKYMLHSRQKSSSFSNSSNRKSNPKQNPTQMMTPFESKYIGELTNEDLTNLMRNKLLGQSGTGLEQARKQR